MAIMKLAVCFDDYIFVDNIRDIINGLLIEQMIEIQYFDSKAMLKKIDDNEFDYDLVIMDIHFRSMKMDGILLGGIVSGRYPACGIIYIADDYSAIPRIYDVKHYCFFLKNEINVWLDHYIEKYIREEFDMMNDYLNVISKRRRIVISQSMIEYIERKERLVEIHTRDNIYEIYSSIREINNRLNTRFCRCHGSFIVNMNYVKEFDGQELEVESGVFIPIGKTYKSIFETQYRKYLENKSM